MVQRVLRVEFQLDDAVPTSSTDFANFATYGDSFVKVYVEAELLSVADELGFPAAWKVQLVEEGRRLAPGLPTPSEVQDVRHQSPWVIVLAIPAALLMPFIYKCLNPVIREAWNDSDLKEKFFIFMRDRVFRGAKTKIENQAALMPRKKNLRVRDVQEIEGDRDRPTIRVKLERTTVIEVEISDDHLLQEFRDRLGK